MVLARWALSSFSSAAMGLALAGIASGQILDVDTGAAADVKSNVVQDSASALDTNLDTDVGVDPDANQNSNRIRANAEVQANETRTDAPLNTDGIRADQQLDVDNPAADIRSDVNARSQLDADVEGSPARANADVRQGLNATANRDAFGVTFDSSVTDGLVIQQALPNSAAARIGLQPGDRIVRFNGRTYTNADGFHADLDGFNSNSNAPITYERNGRLYTRNISLSSQNGVRNSGSFDNSVQSHSAGRPIYGDSDSHYGDATGTMNDVYTGQTNGSGYCCGGGNSGYQPATVCSRKHRHARVRHRVRCCR